MNTRRAYPTIFYNGTNIQSKIDEFLESVKYTDSASGESDSISITLGNWDDRWLNGWFPDKGATLSGKVTAENWYEQDEDLSLDFGDFTLDDISFSGSPDVMTMSGVSAPANDAFQSTQRTKTWENVTILQILTEISERYELGLVYHAEEIKISKLEQSNATDSAFLNTVCSDYGLSLKVYGDRIVVFDREQYKLLDTVATIDKGDMLSYSFKTGLAGTYTGGELVYTDTSGQKITAKAGSGTRILKSNASATTAEEAKAKLLAAIYNANNEATTLSFSTIGNPMLTSGQTIDITGLGKADGKYYINKLEHSIGSAYTTSFDCSKVYDDEDFVVEFSGGGTVGSSSKKETDKNRLKNLKAKIADPPKNRQTGQQQ